MGTDVLTIRTFIPPSPRAPEPTPDRSRRQRATDRHRERYRTDPLYRARQLIAQSDYRWKTGVPPRPFGPRALNHGTTTAYSRGCRCERCRAAMAQYRASRREARAA